MSLKAVADGNSDEFRRASDDLPDDLQKLMVEVASRAELVFASYALFATGRMARGIKAVQDGDGFLIRAEARDPKSGFDYVGVTRFGHRKKWIYPRKDRAPASVIATRGARATGRRAALAFVGKGGKLIFRRRVRGFKPASDWVADALPAVEAEAQSKMTVLGHGFVARLER